MYDILVMPAFLNYLRKSLLVIQYDLFLHEKSLTSDSIKVDEYKCIRQPKNKNK